MVSTTQNRCFVTKKTFIPIMITYSSKMMVLFIDVQNSCQLMMLFLKEHKLLTLWKYHGMKLDYVSECQQEFLQESSDQEYDRANISG